MIQHALKSMWHQVDGKYLYILNTSRRFTNILSSVWVRLGIFFSYPLYNIWGCVFSVYTFPLWWLIEYTRCLIIIIKSEVWTIIHCLVLGNETMICAVCLSIFLWIKFNTTGKKIICPVKCGTKWLIQSSNFNSKYTERSKYLILHSIFDALKLIHERSKGPWSTTAVTFKLIFVINGRDIPLEITIDIISLLVG